VAYFIDGWTEVKYKTAITLIFATMPFSASLADEFTRAMCSASQRVFMYSAEAETHSRHMHNNSNVT